MCVDSDVMDFAAFTYQSHQYTVSEAGCGLKLGTARLIMALPLPGRRMHARQESTAPECILICQCVISSFDLMTQK